MANPVKGEVGFDHDGKAYRLSFSINALCELEDRLGEGVMQIMSRMETADGLRASTMRTMFWAALLDQIPDMTETDAGTIMTSIGITKAFELCGEAFGRAFPEAAEPVPLAAPRQQRGSTGKRR